MRDHDHVLHYINANAFIWSLNVAFLLMYNRNFEQTKKTHRETNTNKNENQLTEVIIMLRSIKEKTQI